MTEHTLALGAMAEEMTKVIEINTQAITNLNSRVLELETINADLLEALIEIRAHVEYRRFGNKPSMFETARICEKADVAIRKTKEQS